MLKSIKAFSPVPTEIQSANKDSASMLLTPQRHHADDLLHEYGVHLIGDFSGNTSLSQSARDVLSAVKHLGCPYEVLDIPLSPDRFCAEKTLHAIRGADIPKSPISIIAWNSDVYEMLAKNLPATIFDNRHVIGTCYWETNNPLPESHRRGLDFVDEIWVTSDFVGNSIALSSDLPVYKYPHHYRVTTVPSTLSVPPELQHDRFTFLFTFDARSVIRRKNPQAVCEAFIRAFPEAHPHGPVCVIKSIAANEANPLEYLEMISRFINRPDIIFMDRYLPLAERDSLLARADCYISLHRSEGLGLSMMESMVVGKPCIATGYSGNLEFMTPDNSWLIPYSMVNIGPGVWPYPPDHQWAEANVDAAAAAMLEVYLNPELREKKASLGQATVLEKHSLAAVSNQLSHLIKQTYLKPLADKKARSSTASAIPVQGETLISRKSHRSLAYDLLRQTRSLETEMREQKKAMKKVRMAKPVRRYIETLQKVIKTQRQAQSITLREIGDIKQRLKSFDGSVLNTLLRDREYTIKLLQNFILKDREK